MEKAYQIIDRISEAYKNILKDNLLGIYLHGSLAMNCYSDKSDIDLFIVVEKAITDADKLKLIDVILQIEDGPSKGIEMSIVKKEYLNPFKYPTPFELHYSDFHRDSYIKGHYICQGDGDKDLAAHVMIINKRGIKIYGQPIEEVFGQVPKAHYIDALMYDIENATDEIIETPVYIILNLCRVLYYLKEEVISSKEEGGLWGYEHLPSRYKNIIDLALEAYKTTLDFDYDKETLLDFSVYMLDQINEYLKE